MRGVWRGERRSRNAEDSITGPQTASRDYSQSRYDDDDSDLFSIVNVNNFEFATFGTDFMGSVFLRAYAILWPLMVTWKTKTGLLPVAKAVHFYRVSIEA